MYYICILYLFPFLLGVNFLDLKKSLRRGKITISLSLEEQRTILGGKETQVFDRLNSFCVPLLWAETGFVTLLDLTLTLGPLLPANLNRTQSSTLDPHASIRRSLTDLRTPTMPLWSWNVLRFGRPSLWTGLLRILHIPLLWSAPWTLCPLSFWGFVLSLTFPCVLTLGGASQFLEFPLLTDFQSAISQSYRASLAPQLCLFSWAHLPPLLKSRIAEWTQATAEVEGRLRGEKTRTTSK